jgi:YVTN family beta-propeller protein
MIKQNFLYALIPVLLTFFFISSCNKDDEEVENVVRPDNRVFIINEGPFQSGSGSLSIFYRDTEEVDNNVFESANGYELGNLVQSLSVHGDKVYIVVNNAGRIEVADKEDLVSTASIENVNLPRYFLGVSDSKGYVSSWDNKVYIIDLNTNAVSGQIITATGPERMLKVGESVWVLNQGGFGVDSLITVIDIQNDQVVKSIVVDKTPGGIVQDKNGNIWVLCSGKGWNGFPAADDSKGSLLCIDPNDYSIIKTLEFPLSDAHPEKLVIDKAGETVYYNYPGGIYSQDLSKSNLELKKVIASSVMFYGLGYDPSSSLLFASNPLDYVQNGLVYRIDPVLEEKLDSFPAGIIPGGFVFN